MFLVSVFCYTIIMDYLAGLAGGKPVNIVNSNRASGGEWGVVAHTSAVAPKCSLRRPPPNHGGLQSVGDGGKRRQVLGQRGRRTRMHRRAGGAAGHGSGASKGSSRHQGARKDAKGQRLAQWPALSLMVVVVMMVVVMMVMVMMVVVMVVVVMMMVVILTLMISTLSRSELARAVDRGRARSGSLAR